MGGEELIAQLVVDRGLPYDFNHFVIRFCISTGSNLESVLRMLCLFVLLSHCSDFFC